MKLEIRHPRLRATFDIDVAPYSRGEGSLGIDFGNSNYQIKINGISPRHAYYMMRELRALTAGSYTEEADSILLKQKVHVMVKRNEELAILLKEAIRLADLTGHGALAQSTMGGSMFSKLNSALNITQQEII